MFGIFKRILNKRKKRNYEDIAPDEIFLDSKNLPNFNTYQFEGRLEKPLSARVFSIFGLVCVFIILIFLIKIISLQVVNGSLYRDRSKNNKLKQTLLIAPRGSIYSREGKRLVWNQKSKNSKNYPSRKYINIPGFSNLLGFIKYPAKDKSGFYYEEDFLPKAGAELYLNEILAGKNGSKLIETSAREKIVSQSVVQLPRDGKDATLSIDSRIQEKLYKTIKNLAHSVGFRGGAGIIMDVNSGEILAMANFPEYSSEVMTEGKNVKKIKSYYKNADNPFLNRAISGLYTPGSIIKPFLAFAALQEKIITPEKKILSTGSITVPNPYFPNKPSVFKDWKAHGWVDMVRAIAVSSDVYFYEIGGGFDGQQGLGIKRIKKYLEKFGFAEKTGFDLSKEAIGVIPDPKWKRKNFNGEIWRLGDTYNTAIGQYGMQVTPIQMVTAIAALANEGNLVIPSILFTATSTKISGVKIKGLPKNFQIVKKGMRMSVLEGTARGLNIKAVEIAGKTGTAELGSKKQFVNSWVIGFFPYKNPKYAFTVVMEKGPETNLLGGVYVMRQLFDWMAINTPEYFK